MYFTTPTNTPTHTSTPNLTPTPTPEFIKTCGRVVKDSGKGVFTYVVDITNSTGIVSLHYNTYLIPDRFVVEFDDTVVIDTGYVGDTSYNDDLISLGLPVVLGLGDGVITFNKTSSNKYAYITVYAPLKNSTWSFTFSCLSFIPGTTPSNTSTISYTPTHTPTATHTQTPTSVTNTISCGTVNHTGSGTFTYRIVPSYPSGTISIAYNTYSIPDRFTLIHGSYTRSTGFVGDASYNENLIAAGYPPVQDDSQGILSYNIEPNVDTILIIEAPLPNTVFTFTVMCPSPTPTVTSTPTHTPSHSPTPTPQITPFHTPTQTPTHTPGTTSGSTPCPTTTPTHTPTYTPTASLTGTPPATPAGTPPSTPTCTPSSGPCGIVPDTDVGYVYDYGWLANAAGCSAGGVTDFSGILAVDFGRNCCPTATGGGPEKRYWTVFQGNAITAIGGGEIDDTTNRATFTGYSGEGIIPQIPGWPNASGQQLNTSAQFIETYDYSEEYWCVVYCNNRKNTLTGASPIGGGPAWPDPGANPCPQF